MFDLTGKSALVTGAAQGIGLAAAKALAGQGASVVLADVNARKLEESAYTIKEMGLITNAVTMDVASNASIEAAIEKTIQLYGRLDIVVNSAGILSAATIESMQRDEWDRVLDINLTGAFFVSRAALPYLKQSGSGRIINISSLTGRMGGFNGSMCYAASKGGINSITFGMARHLSKTGITVNAVCPGPTETDILKTYTPEALEQQKKVPLVGRLGKPEEIGAAVCYLASDEAAFVTGLLLDINGGAYMG